MIQNRVEASRNASRLRPCWSSSVNTGTNAADSAACENRLLNRFGTCEASVNAEDAALVPKNAAWATSRPSPAIRESAVANAKIAVLTAIRRRGGSGGGGSRPGGAGGSALRRGGRIRAISIDLNQGGYSTARAAAETTRGFLSAHGEHPLTEEASCAPSASGSRTAATRRGSRRTSVASSGPSPPAMTPRRTPSTVSSCRTIDKAVKRGALHRNNGARKKSRAARVRRG